MKLIVVLGLGCGLGVAGAVEFEPPVCLKAGDEFIRVEQPGYAAPCLADMDGDGKKDLLVGQFARGKIKVYRRVSDLEFATGEWLKADDKVVEVPGVW